MSNLRFENVSKLFGQSIAIRDLNFEIEEGEFVVFVGPSGCGKTTTLRMLAGLEAPSYGKIWIGDHDVTVAPPGERDISMVFQSYALFPHMSVYKNLAFGPEVRGLRKADIRDRVHRVAEVLHLKELLHRKPAELSGGQRQRIALGRTLIRQPKIFLLDEPLSNLDAALRTTMRSEIINLQKTLKVTTVYVTHDQVEAMTMGHRIAVFKDGVILQFATPRELYKNPANKFVACFVGSPKMNVLLASLSVQSNPASLRLLGSTVSISYNDLRDSCAVDGLDVEVGLRPQDLHWASDAPSRCTHRIRGTVIGMETTGPETFVTLDIEGTLINAKFPSFANIAEDQQVELALNPDDLHLFDHKSGDTLFIKRGQVTEAAANRRMTLSVV